MRTRRTPSRPGRRQASTSLPGARGSFGLACCALNGGIWRRALARRAPRQRSAPMDENGHVLAHEGARRVPRAGRPHFRNRGKGGAARSPTAWPLLRTSSRLPRGPPRFPCLKAEPQDPRGCGHAQRESRVWPARALRRSGRRERRDRIGEAQVRDRAALAARPMAASGHGREWGRPDRLGNLWCSWVRPQLWTARRRAPAPELLQKSTIGCRGELGRGWTELGRLALERVELGPDLGESLRMRTLAERQEPSLLLA